MSVTLDQILMLAGRLDDASGYDAPRERYRRFLLDYVHDWSAAKAWRVVRSEIDGINFRHAMAASIANGPAAAIPK